MANIENLTNQIRKLNDRLEKKEEQRWNLISFVTKIIDQKTNETKHLKRLNKLQEIKMQQQEKQIQEDKSTIERLKGEINLLKLSNRQEYEKKPVGELQTKNKKLFTHPCFKTDIQTQESQQLKRKKIFRCKNLDITIKKDYASAKRFAKVNSLNDKDQNKSKLEKTRKLFCADQDELVDLVNVEEE